MSFPDTMTINSIAYEKISQGSGVAQFYMRDATTERYFDIKHYREKSGAEVHTVKHTVNTFAAVDVDAYSTTVSFTFKSPSLHAVAERSRIDTILNFMGYTYAATPLTENTVRLVNFET